MLFHHLFYYYVNITIRKQVAHNKSSAHKMGRLMTTLKYEENIQHFIWKKKVQHCWRFDTSISHFINKYGDLRKETAICTDEDIPLFMERH